MAEVLYDDQRDLRISLAQGITGSGRNRVGSKAPHIRVETFDDTGKRSGAGCLTLDEAAEFYGELGRVLAARGRVAT